MYITMAYVNIFKVRYKCCVNIRNGSLMFAIGVKGTRNSGNGNSQLLSEYYLYIYKEFQFSRCSFCCCIRRERLIGSLVDCGI